MDNYSWLDSIVEAMQMLGGHSHYSELYPVVKKIREERNLSIPTSFKACIRERIEACSSDSKHFSSRDIFTKIGKGHWGLRDLYQNAQTFTDEPIEEKNNETISHSQNVFFENEIDDLSLSEDGKQLSNMEEARIKKLHYTYEGRLTSAQIRRIKLAKKDICEACGMSFSKKYPGIGNKFIECHHKIPYSNIKEGGKRRVNPDDFIVLCSNCHRMIHRLDDPANLDELKSIIARGKLNL